MAWKRIPGSSRRYVNPDTGVEISYRQYRRLYELSESYRPLELSALAAQRRKQTAFNRLVQETQKARQARVLARLDTRGMGLIEQARAEREAMRSIRKADIIREAQFREDAKTFKELGHRPPRKLTVEERERITEALIRTGQREGIPRNVLYGDSETFRRGLMRQNKAGAWVPVKGAAKKLRSLQRAAGRRVDAKGRSR